MVRFVKEREIHGFVVNLGEKNGKKGNVRVNKSRDDNEHSSHFVLETREDSTLLFVFLKLGMFRDNNRFRNSYVRFEKIVNIYGMLVSRVTRLRDPISRGINEGR